MNGSRGSDSGKSGRANFLDCFIIREMTRSRKTPIAVARVKRAIKIVFGFTLLVAGVAMLALPGPGWLTIALALASLAGEFVWARKLLNRLKNVGDTLKPGTRRSRPEQDRSGD